MPLLICSDCGVLVPDAHASRKRCVGCAKKRDRARVSRRNWKRPKAKPAEPRPCVDCGQEYTPLVNNPLAKRCPACRQVLKDRYVAIRDIRSAFGTLAQVSPAEAKEIEKQMRAEEGDDFVEFALDGIPTKMHEGTLPALRSRGPGRPFAAMSRSKRIRQENREQRLKQASP